MARLPVPGGDDNQWGEVLNDFLAQTHQPDGTLKAGSVSEGTLDTALATKVNQPTPHTHVIADVNNLQSNLDTLASNSANLCAALGAIAWTVDPEVATFVATQANTHLGAVYLAKNQVVTSLAVPVTSPGSGLTLGILALYDEGFNLLAQTPNSPGTFQSNGWKKVDLTAPYQVPSSGLYYLGSGWLGSTLPSILNIQHISSLSQGFPSGKPRGVHAAVPSAGALPDPATPTGNYTNHPLIVAL